MNRLFSFLSAVLLLALISGRPAAAQAPAASYRFEWAQVHHQHQYLWQVDQPVASDVQGNAYVIGTLRGGQIAQLDTLTLSNNAAPGNDLELYLAKLNPAGRLQWVRRGRSLAANGGNWASRVVVDRLGNVFVSGSALDSMDFGGLQLLNPIGQPRRMGNFLAKFNTNGQGQWIRKLPFDPNPTASTDAFGITSLAPDNLGNCLLTGYSWNLDSLGTLPLANNGTNDGFVAKVSGATGDFEWVRQVSGSVPTFYGFGYNINGSITTAVTADAAGNVLVAGGFGFNGDDTLRFSPTQALFAASDTTSDAYVARYDRHGTLQWVRQARPSVSRGGGWMRIRALATDPLGNVFVAGSTFRFDFGPLSQVAAFAGFTIPASGLFVAKLDAAGTGLWLQPANELYDFTQQQLTLLVDDAGNPMVAGGFWQVSNQAVVPRSDLFVKRYSATGDTLRTVKTTPSAPNQRNKTAIGAALGAGAREVFLYVSVDSADVLGTLPINVSGPALVLTKVNLQAANAYLGGSVYLDQNANGRRDSTEAPFPRQVLVQDSATGQVLVHYADAPTYGYDVAPGAYSLRALYAHPYYHPTQPGTGGAHRVGVPVAGQRVDTLTFGLAPIPGLNDLRITITPYTEARPGRVCRYRVYVQNVGTTTLTGQASATFPAVATLLSAMPAANQQQGQTLTWNFQNLPPFGARAYDFAVSLPTNVAAATVLTSSAQVTPLSGDQTPTDNLDTAEQVVITSWDPNDLAVNFSQLTTAQIAAGQPLDYTVRFENLGTDTAFTVIIQDTLPANLLQLATVDLVSQSHNCRWTCTPAGILTIRFRNINLSSRNANAFFSQGFVRFRVIPRTTLTGGQLIPNRAHIVFDYNAPVSTNRATTIVDNPTGLLAASTPPLRWSLFPNPAAQRVTLTGLDLPAPAPLTVRLLDALGRETRVLQVNAPAGLLRQSLELRDVAPGVYVVELRVTGSAPWRQRLVVQAAD